MWWKIAYRLDRHRAVLKQASDYYRSKPYLVRGEDQHRNSIKLTVSAYKFTLRFDKFSDNAEIYQYDDTPCETGEDWEKLMTGYNTWMKEDILASSDGTRPEMQYLTRELCPPTREDALNCTFVIVEGHIYRYKVHADFLVERKAPLSPQEGSSWNCNNGGCSCQTRHPPHTRMLQKQFDIERFPSEFAYGGYLEVLHIKGTLECPDGVRVNPKPWKLFWVIEGTTSKI